MIPQEFIIWLEGFLSSVESIGDLTNREKLVQDKLKQVSAPAPKLVPTPSPVDTPTPNPYKNPRIGGDEWYPRLPQVYD